MSEKTQKSGSAAGMEDNLKKAVSEMLVLLLLRERDMYIGEITDELRLRSGGACGIVFPYSILYRMQNFGYIEERRKQTAPDGRRRQYYGLTTEGETHLLALLACYDRFSSGVTALLRSAAPKEES